MLIYKILTATRWAALEQGGGLVHFPTGAQVFPERVGA